MKINWNPTDSQDALQILTPEEAQAKYPDIFKNSILLGNIKPIKFNRVILDQGVISGTFAIPIKKHPIKNQITFEFFLDKTLLVFIGDKGLLEELIDGFMNHFETTFDDPLEFLLGLMSYMIREDIYFLEEYNRKLESIEENLFKNRADGMEKYIMKARRDMNILGSYYLQMSAVGEMIEEIVIERGEGRWSSFLSLYVNRVNQLFNMVEQLKDFTSQIWNLRQTQLSDRQNKISTILTIITAIFLPLNLVTGWFGMNFVDMPLVKEPYGFWATVIFCIVVVVLELLFIRRHHWLENNKID